jgi:putative PIN family toxin of toxin-antitoxin system
LKVVFDSNIFISAFAVPGGKAEEVYLRVLRGDFDLCSSVAILTETAQKLGEKFGWPENQIVRLLQAISKVATVIKTRAHLHVLADESDNRILECAVEAAADFIVTGDKRLLSLKNFQDIRIITLSNFLKILGKD